jgi:hypothetical protein
MSTSADFRRADRLDRGRGRRGRGAQFRTRLAGTRPAGGLGLSCSVLGFLVKRSDDGGRDESDEPVPRRFSSAAIPLVSSSISHARDAFLAVSCSILPASDVFAPTPSLGYPS